MTESFILWLKQAEADYDTALYNFNGKKYYACAFLCQQAAEKALKALIIKKEKILPKIHDLYILGKRVSLEKKLLGKVSKLSIVYTESRYRLEEEIPAERFKSKECEEYLKTAKEVLEWVKKRI